MPWLRRVMRGILKDPKIEVKVNVIGRADRFKFARQ
jgi:hypothetical protein